MTSAPTQLRSEPLTKVATDSEGAAVSVPLLLLLGSGVLWLLVGGVLSLIGSIQLHSPDFLADCVLLTHGRVVGLAETAFLYGWIGNAGLALGLWILSRLAGEPLPGGIWVGVGAAFWNLGVTLGLIGIATGGATSIPMLDMPRNIQPLLLSAYAAIAVGGVGAWAGRKREAMFAAQWYAVAALFLFPWLFSVAQVMLLWFPVRGVLQAVVAGWFAQSMWTLWAAPLALAGAYYVVPRVTGRVLPAYDSASLGFWCLLFLGGWTGGRHLIGGPIPAWLSTIAIVTAVMLIFHYIIVFLNLRGAFGAAGMAVRFIGFGVAAYVIGGFLDACTAMRSVAAVTQFTYVDEAQLQLAFYGGATMMIFGTLYFALPRILGIPWASGPLVKGHFALTALGLLLLVVALGAAGWAQGTALADPKVPFADIAGLTRGWLLGATAARGILLFANVLLAVNFFKTCAGACCFWGRAEGSAS
jgi:cytochrome c oxidase cbb3-type subunit 1